MEVKSITEKSRLFSQTPSSGVWVKKDEKKTGGSDFQKILREECAKLTLRKTREE